MYERVLKPEERRIRMAIGKNLRIARQEMSMSLDYVAKETGYPKSKLSEMETGKHTPNAIQIGRFAELYNVSPSFFYTGKEAGIGEDKFFDMRRVLKPVRDEMDQYLMQVVTKLCAKAFPAESEAELLLQAVGEFISYSKGLVAKNYSAGWQEIKGGNNFTVKLDQLDYRYRMAQEAMHNKKRADKEIRSIEQQHLF